MESETGFQGESSIGRCLIRSGFAHDSNNRGNMIGKDTLGVTPASGACDRFPAREHRFTGAGGIRTIPQRRSYSDGPSLPLLVAAISYEWIFNSNPGALPERTRQSNEANP